MDTAGITAKKFIKPVLLVVFNYKILNLYQLEVIVSLCDEELDVTDPKSSDSDSRSKNEIVNVEFEIRYMFKGFASGPGFYAGIQVTRNGKWSTLAMAKASYIWLTSDG